MRILWDFRLFSYGYRDRGVGVFCRAMVKAIMEADANAVAGHKCDIYIWGNRSDVPAECAGYARRWIPYKKGSWKSDLFIIPLIILRHRIQLFHYWVALGPVFRIGMGLFHPCTTCMTVYDLGVEQVHDHDFLEHVRGTNYWRFQKMLLKGADRIACISQKTRDEVLLFTHYAEGPRFYRGSSATGCRSCILRLFMPKEIFGAADSSRRGSTKAKYRRCDVIYMPVGPARPQTGTVYGGAERMRMFITLDGAPHKNVQNVRQAFSIFMESHPGFCLVVLGDAQSVEDRKTPVQAANAVFFEGMDRYEYYLDNAAGLVVCSTYEGLGIPLLEALSHGCPLVVSDMQVFQETCGGAARFVNPLDAASIAEGMSDVADHQREWMIKSGQGYERYCRMSADAGKRWIELYRTLCGK